MTAALPEIDAPSAVEVMTAFIRSQAETRAKVIQAVGLKLD